MAKVARQAVVHIYDVLAGCRTLLAPISPSGTALEMYLPLVEQVLDIYFFGERFGGLDHLAEYIEAAHDAPPSLSREICQYLERELIRRIQNTFSTIYPSRHYHFNIDDGLGHVEITESLDVYPPVPVIEPLDETDAYIPERLRHHTTGLRHSHS